MRFLSLAAAAAIAVLAAQPAAGQPAAPGASDRASASAETLRRTALIERLLDVIEFDTTLDKTFDAALPALVDRYFPTLSASEKAEMQGLVREAIDDLVPAFRQTVIDLYAEIYSEAELAAMIVFYDSPEGRSINAKTPIMTLRQQEALTRLGPAITEAVRRRGCERFGCGEQAPRA